LQKWSTVPNGETMRGKALVGFRFGANLGGQFLGDGSAEIIPKEVFPIGVLRVWSKATLKSLLVPGGILLLGVAVLLYSGWLTLALPALSFLYYCALIGGMLLAWRFHSSRSFFALVVLFLTQEAIALFGAGHFSPGTSGWTAVQASAVLVPLDFVLIVRLRDCPRFPPERITRLPQLWFLYRDMLWCCLPPQAFSCWCGF